jgi:hypothetical protein
LQGVVNMLYAIDLAAPDEDGQENPTIH